MAFSLLNLRVQTGTGAHPHTHTPNQRIPRALHLEVKWPGREAHYSPLSNAEVKECVELYFHSPNASSWRGA